MSPTGAGGRPTPYERRARAAADLVRVITGLAALVVLALGHVEAGITLGLVAITTIAVRFAGASATMELAFVAMASADAALNAAGAFRTFNHSDGLGHLLLPAAVAPIVWAALQRAGVAIDPERRWTAVVVAAAATIALGTAWELVEWSSDALFGTHLSLGYSDTLRDLGTDMTAAVIGSILFVRPEATRRAVTAPPAATTASLSAPQATR